MKISGMGKIMEKWKDKEERILLIKRIIYTLCIVKLCQIDQIMGSAYGGVQFAVRNQIGFVIAIFILSTFHWKDFLKIPYLVWAVLFFIGRSYALQWGKENWWSQEQWQNIIWNVGIYGMIIIRLFYKMVVEKQRPRMNWPLYGMWAVMMLIMIFSKSDLTWPLWFFVMFGTFYLTDFTQKEIDALKNGIVDGLILGFLLIQGVACLRRPYDTLRYEGMYANCNVNGLFYLVVYCALLCKWYCLKRDNKHLIWRILNVLLIGVVWGLGFLTISRTVLVVLGLETLFFIIFMMLISQRHKIREGFICGIVIVVTIVMSFLPTYYCVRYLPAIINKPMYFYMEDAGVKVNISDSINSKKYVELDEVVKASFGRILWFIDFPQEEAEEVLKPPVVESIENEEKEKPAPMKPFEIRGGIWEWYWRELNWNGHLSEENGMQLTEDDFVTHAHNIFLQMAFDFGIIAGGIFIGIIGAIVVKLIREIRKKNKSIKWDRIFIMGSFTLLIVSFGMFDCDWGIGQVSFILFWMIQYMIYNKSGLSES